MALSDRLVRHTLLSAPSRIRTGLQQPAYDQTVVLNSIDTPGPRHTAASSHLFACPCIQAQPKSRGSINPNCAVCGAQSALSILPTQSSAPWVPMDTITSLVAAPLNILGQVVGATTAAPTSR